MVEDIIVIKDIRGGGAMQGARGGVAVFNSRVARGGVGARAVEFVLESAGFPVWSVPTILAPWHPGHGRATWILPGEDDFAALIDDLCGARWLGELAAAQSGYARAGAQAVGIARFVDALKRARPDALYLCDPVLGDAGALYVPEEAARAIREALVPRADILTPNAFELSWLTGWPVGDAGEAARAARALGLARVLVTSVPAADPGRLSTLLVTPDRVLAAETPALRGVPNGTGDLIAGLFLSRLLAGADEGEALAGSVAATFALVEASVRAGADELLLVHGREHLAAPAGAVPVSLLETGR